jgi:ATP-dependent HslUV protease ATP-binding subunit HslU
MHLKPKEIVSYLDNYIIGQKDAKKAMAIALRNRYRRMQLPKEIQDDIMPKNILMIGSTGVGKTEIARRLAKMMSLPFIKVEASKYTEVGFVGRDVESMVRDLVTASVRLVTQEYQENNQDEIDDKVIIKIVEKLLPPIPKSSGEANQKAYSSSFEKMKQKVINGDMDDKIIEIDIPKNRNKNIDSNLPPEIANMQESLGNMFGMLHKESNKREVTIKEAKELLKSSAIDSILDQDFINKEAISRVENGGIIFLDEIDKIAISSQNRNDPSKEGVQRDLLPIIEGSSINTKYGIVKSDHILFIAAGAFHVSRPSDLIPELQGRFPLRVELNSLTKDDLHKILTSTKNSLIKQYKALLDVENITIEFEDSAIEAMAKLSSVANEKTEDIGARRLHTIIERILEDISYNCDEYENQTIKITQELVHEKLDNLVEDEDSARYIL